MNTMERFPGVRKLERKGDIIEVEFFGGHGACGCPMIRDGHQEPRPAWCTCGNYWYKTMIEAVVGHPVRVDLVSSCIRTGPSTCKRRVHLNPSKHPTKKYC